MPFKCSVVHCTGNYRNGQKVSVFKFPEDKELRQLWLQRLKRKDFELSASSRVCELHFKEDEVMRETEDPDPKTGKIIRLPLLCPRLKKGAIPSIIPECSSNLQPIESGTRRRKSSVSKKKKLEGKVLELTVAATQISRKENDERSFNSLLELKKFLKKNRINEEFNVIEKKDKVMFIKISVVDIPKVDCSVIVNSNLEVNVYVKDQLITKLGKYNFSTMIVKDINTLIEILEDLERLCYIRNNCY